MFLRILAAIAAVAAIGGMVWLFVADNGGCPKGQSLEVSGWSSVYNGHGVSLEPTYACEVSKS